MKRRMHMLRGLGLAGLLIGALNAAPPPTGTNSPASSAIPAPAPVRKPPAPKRKVTGYPFHGRLGAVDPVKKTITVTTKHTRRVFPVNAKTKFIKNGKPAKLTDGVVGEEVAGYVRKLDDGKLLAISVRFGPKPKTKAKKSKNRSSKSKSAPPAPPKQP